MNIILPAVAVALVALLFVAARVAKTTFVGGEEGMSLSEATPCGIDGIDRLPIAETVAEVFGPDATVAIARIMVAICWCETGGRTDPPVVGDTSSSGGPSIGPLQVWRQTAIDYGLVPRMTSKDTYRAFAASEMLCLKWGVEVFRRKLSDAGGDLADAIRRYNGSGDAARAYRDKALSFLAEKFGDNWEV